MEMWIIWLIFALCTFIIEIFTPGFVIACFGIAAVLVSPVSLVVKNIFMQIGIFSILCITVFVFIRPLANKMLYTKVTEKNRTNTEGLIGKIGIVTMDINPKTLQGYVKVYGDEWKAISSTNELIKSGSQVVIEKIDGIKVFVRKVHP